MAKRKYKKKKNTFNIDIACIMLICIGILSYYEDSTWSFK